MNFQDAYLTALMVTASLTNSRHYTGLTAAKQAVLALCQPHTEQHYAKEQQP
jgi:hypothetical protein